MDLIDDLNMILEIATIQFFAKNINLDSSYRGDINELDINNLPYHLNDNEWIAKMLMKEQNLYEINLSIILNYIKKSKFFLEQKRYYEREFVRVQINRLSSRLNEGNFFLNYSIDCDLIFREKLVLLLKEMGMSNSSIEDGIEKNAVWWRETYMRYAFDNQFECITYYPVLDGKLSDLESISLEPADIEHKVKWLKLRRYEYYQRHKNSIDKYGEIVDDMLMSNKEVVKLKKDLAKINAERLVLIEKFKENTGWHPIYMEQTVIDNRPGLSYRKKHKGRFL